jgi:excisionase family DNA binding protein
MSSTAGQLWSLGVGAADDVMTAREVALLLHAPISTVEDWVRRGILPSVKIGRRRLYIRQDIEAALMSPAPGGHSP